MIDDCIAVARQMKTINYCLSSQKCLEEGWTIRPPSPLIETDHESDVFEPQPILPPWADPEKVFISIADGNVVIYPKSSQISCFITDD